MATTSTDRRRGINPGAAIKVPCNVCATTNITLSGEQTIDSFTTNASRALLTGQTNPVQNGIWDTTTGTWTRAKDWDGVYDVVTGTLVYVNPSSAINKGFWYVSTTGTITPGTTSVTLSGASSILSVISSFMQTVVDDTTAAAARTTLEAVGLVGNETIAGNKTLSGTTTLSGTNTLSGATTLSGTNTLSGATTISGATTLSGATTTISGAATSSSSHEFTSTKTHKLTDAGATLGPQTKNFRDSSSPAVSDEIGSYDLDGRDSAGNQETYARVGGTISSPTNGSESGIGYLSSIASGTLAKRLHWALGLYSPSATGGDKGADTINFKEIYDDDVRIYPLGPTFDTPTIASGTTYQNTSGATQVIMAWATALALASIEAYQSTTSPANNKIGHMSDAGVDNQGMTITLVVQPGTFYRFNWGTTPTFRRWTA